MVKFCDTKDVIALNYIKRLIQLDKEIKEAKESLSFLKKHIKKCEFERQEITKAIDKIND